jgi:hypothetical protein
MRWQGLETRKLIVKAAACALVFVTIPMPAPADDYREYKARAIAQPTSPVSIEFCEARHVDGQLLTGADYRNTGSQTVVAVRIGFVPVDAFGGAAGPVGVSGDDMASVAPGALQKHSHGNYRMWRIGVDTWAQVDHVDCSVEKVKFVDGAIWSR